VGFKFLPGEVPPATKRAELFLTRGEALREKAEAPMSQSGGLNERISELENCNDMIPDRWLTNEKEGKNESEGEHLIKGQIKELFVSC
jgi:hypothetical protein